MAYSQTNIKLNTERKYKYNLWEYTKIIKNKIFILKSIIKA